jgi:hypothetical protein
MRAFLVLCLVVHLFNQSVLSQNKENNSEIIVNSGIAIGTGVDVLGDTLVILPHLSGHGGVTWFFELPDNRLVIVDFRWMVTPDAKVSLHSRYLRTPTSTRFINPDLEYSYFFDIENAKGSWVRLKGKVLRDMAVDIKINYPYWTDTEDAEFNSLLHKFGLKKKYQ